MAADTKERVRDYRAKNPDASLRAIQKALGISSPSVVKFHLDNDRKRGEIMAVLKAANQRLLEHGDTLRHPVRKRIAKLLMGNH